DRVLNRGRARAGRFTVSFRLSRASGSARLRIGGRNVTSLRRERRSSATTRVRLPGALPAGSYRLAACADDPARIDESHEENNCVTTAAPIRLVPGDRTPPTSSASGPAYTRSVVIPVEYTAGGTGSRLARVELWVRTPNAGAYSLASTDNAPAASGHFDYTAAVGDGAYRFFTIAYDRAGNAEPAPGGPDSTTTLDTSPP